MTLEKKFEFFLRDGKDLVFLHCMICYCRYDNRRHLEFCIVSMATNCAVIALLMHENVIWVQNSNIIGPSNICFYSKQKNFRFTIKIHFFRNPFFRNPNSGLLFRNPNFRNHITAHKHPRKNPSIFIRPKKSAILKSAILLAKFFSQS